MLVGEKFKLLRRQLRLTQEQFSQQLGIPLSTLKGVESKNQAPSYKILNKIADHADFGHYALWLISSEAGEEPQRNDELEQLDSDLLNNVIEMVERVLADKDVELPSKKKAKLISLLYREYIKEDEPNEIDMSKVIDWVDFAA